MRCVTRLWGILKNTCNCYDLFSVALTVECTFADRSLVYRSRSLVLLDGSIYDGCYLLVG